MGFLDDRHGTIVFLIFELGFLSRFYFSRQEGDDFGRFLKGGDDVVLKVSCDEVAIKGSVNLLSGENGGTSPDMVTEKTRVHVTVNTEAVFEKLETNLD